MSTLERGLKMMMVVVYTMTHDLDAQWRNCKSEIEISRCLQIDSDQLLSICRKPSARIGSNMWHSVQK